MQPFMPYYKKLYFLPMKNLIVAATALMLASCMGGTEKPGRSDTLRRDSLLTAVQPGNALSPIDRSPMDMIYFPVDYPILKTSGKAGGAPLARVIYSRPHRQGRTIFGSLVPYGQPWRLGANEATELELFAPATIQNKPVGKGRYILYCIPQPDEWTIVLNNNLNTWGLQTDTTKDAYRFSVPVETAAQPLEDFTMVFTGAADSASLVIAWEQSKAKLPILFR